mmetsp:Transcript_37696/g.103571  ORF Transcript_37696/g.103571 Transcript_37696/m.103571 type:complete len:210 (+) Transcript_37696:608-1237(+)
MTLAFFECHSGVSSSVVTFWRTTTITTMKPMTIPAMIPMTVHGGPSFCCVVAPSRSSSPVGTLGNCFRAALVTSGSLLTAGGHPVSSSMGSLHIGSSHSFNNRGFRMRVYASLCDSSKNASTYLWHEPPGMPKKRHSVSLLKLTYTNAQHFEKGWPSHVFLLRQKFHSYWPPWHSVNGSITPVVSQGPSKHSIPGSTDSKGHTRMSVGV